MKCRRSLTLVLALSLLLAIPVGCNDSSETPTSNPSEGTSEQNRQSHEDQGADEQLEISDNSNLNGTDTTLISAEGIGVAKLGMTFAELEQTLKETAEFTVESPLIAGFDAIAIRQNGETQFYVLYLSGETFEDDSTIQGLLTTQPTYQTAEGVGVETTIAEAEEIYGNAVLAYSLANESREYARFENHPSNNILFGTHGTGSYSEDYSGIYSTPTAEYNETEDYSPGATIQAVLVVCLTESCS